MGESVQQIASMHGRLRHPVGLIVGVTCLAAALAILVTARQSGIALRLFAAGLKSPTALVGANDDTDRLFVVEQAGVVRVLDAAGRLLPDTLLDVGDRVRTDHVERGLLSLALHPAFRENGRFFVAYTNREGGTNISEFSALVGAASRAATERIVLTVAKPGAPHHGGQLQFGPRDGYLYIATGDGGESGEPTRRARDLMSPLGKILRIDVNGAMPYALPADNPFMGRTDALGEVWARGLRNPWRFSFDRATADLYIADVGAYTWEEIDVVRASDAAGADFGWDTMEGRSCYKPRTLCDRTGLTEPTLAYGREAGCSVIGGYVYRGNGFPALLGSYVFGDFCTGRIWKLTGSGRRDGEKVLLLDTDLSISTFGEGEDGALYVADYLRGNVHLLVADSTAVATNLSRASGFAIVFLVALGVAVLVLGAFGEAMSGPAALFGYVAGMATAVGAELWISQVFFAELRTLNAVTACVVLVAVWGIIADRRRLPGWAIPVVTMFAAVPMMLVRAGFTNLGNTQIGLLYPFGVVPLTMAGSTSATAAWRSDSGAMLLLGTIAFGSLLIIASGLEATLAQLELLAGLGALLAVTAYTLRRHRRDGELGLAMLLGALIAAAVIVGKFERAAPVVLALFVLDLALKATGKFSVDCWRIDEREGRLHCPETGVHSVSQLVLRVTGGLRRWQLLSVLSLVQILLGAFAIYLYANRFDLM